MARRSEFAYRIRLMEHDCWARPGQSEKPFRTLMNLFSSFTGILT